MSKEPIIMTEEYWASSPFSIARYYGRIRISGKEYVIVNKEGKDIYECSIEAEREGRQYAIAPGEPCDLIDEQYKPIYRAVGREQFIAWVEEGLELKDMKAIVKQQKKDKK